MELILRKFNREIMVKESWFKGKNKEFKKVAIALLSSGFLYCGKFDEFYDKDDLNNFETIKVENWYIFISPDENIDIYSEGELLTLPYSTKTQNLSKIKDLIHSILKDSHKTLTNGCSLC